MKRNYVHLELLLGREVVDANGEKIGRIEEAIAEKIDGEWVVTDFLCGRLGAMERFAVRHLGRQKGRRIKWSDLDLTDPEHPRLRR